MRFPLLLLFISAVYAVIDEEEGLVLKNEQMVVFENEIPVKVVGSSQEEIEQKRQMMEKFVEKQGLRMEELTKFIDEEMIDRRTVAKPRQVAFIDPRDTPEFRQLVEKIEAEAKVLISEEEAIGLKHLCRINAYASADDSPEQAKMLRLWLRNWASLGLRPKILRRIDTQGKFILSFTPKVYGSDQQWWETEAFVRWMALFQQGGGTMTDGDVFGMTEATKLSIDEYCHVPGQLTTHNRFIGNVVTGSQESINEYIHDLIIYGHQEMEAKGTRLITDKALARRYPHELFSIIEDYDGLLSFSAMKVMEESKALGLKLDRYDWANEMLKLNLLNRKKINIVHPQDSHVPVHPVRGLLASLKCPAKGVWSPVLPSNIQDTRQIFPIHGATCSINYYGHGRSYEEIKRKPLGPRERPKTEHQQGQKMFLLIEEPFAAAWSRVGHQREPISPNPITRFFFGDRFQDEETFDFPTFNKAVLDLLRDLNKDEELVVVLLDKDLANPRDMKLLLEYSLGFELPEDAADSRVKRPMGTKMDKGWKVRFEDANQPDIVFYMLARDHYERKLGQARFLEKQLKASTTELENMPAKLDL